MSKPKVMVLFYSMYGHVRTLANEITQGIEAAGGEPMLFQVQETLPKEVLEKMHALPQDPAIPVLGAADVEKLAEADGILFGFPTRYGGAPAQLRTVLDATGKLWVGGALLGKPAGVFF
eukprot:RCo040520